MNGKNVEDELEIILNVIDVSLPKGKNLTVIPLNTMSRYTNRFRYSFL